jgi:hypothetical protein
MATVLSLAIIAYMMFLGATYALNPTGPGKWPIAIKLPLPDSWDAFFTSPMGLMLTRINGIIMFLFALWSLVVLLRHQFKL